MIATIFMCLFAYLLGSISSAVLFAKLAKLPDPRTHGSKNPGATNVLRSGGKFAAVAVLLFDMLKGAIPVYLAFRLDIDQINLGFVAISACIGHIFPIFFGFKGGKGVATAFGAMAPISYAIAFCTLSTWVLVILITRYSSVASIVSFLLAPLYIYFLDPRFFVASCMLSVLIIARHSDNIIRLVDGTESQFNKRKS